MHGQHDKLYLRIARKNEPTSLKAIHHRHLQVNNRYIRRFVFYQRAKFFAVFDIPYFAYALKCRQQPNDPLSKKGVVVGYIYGNRLFHGLLVAGYPPIAKEQKSLRICARGGSWIYTILPLFSGRTRLAH